MLRFSTAAAVGKTTGLAPRRWLGLLLLWPLLASAETAVYQGVVPLAGATEADRTAGFGEALRAAVVRASGHREAASQSAIATAAASPARYVLQYSTTADRMLKVGFDGPAVEQLLQQAGLPLWPVERPVTLVALFLPGVAGGSRAVLASEHPPERAELERAAAYRGVPIVWPQRPLDAAAARSGAPDALARALLVGEGAGAALHWSFAHAGQSVQGQGGPAAGVELAADALAARYAPPSTRGLAAESVRVGAVHDLADYAALLRYLKSLSLVREVAVEEVSGEQVRLRLTLRGDLELLRRIAALDSHLQPTAHGPAEGDANPVDFTWQP